MKRLLIYIFLLLIIFSVRSTSQYRGKNFGISLNFSYITTSKLFLFPNVSDPFLQNQYIPLDDILGYSGEFRYAVLEDLILGAGVEYIRKYETGRNLEVRNSLGNVMRVNVEDGYKVYPVKLTVYYVMPFSTEDFKFFMAGGLGAYFSEHVRKFGNLELSDETSEFSYAIHVSVGMDYIVTDYFAVRTEILFRDAEFGMKSRYVTREIVADGEGYTILRESFDSKVNIDGTTFSIGANFFF